MRILISGGIKTQNIVDGLQQKFASDGVDFLIVHYIEDIEAIFARGEYFDRAIIIEPCWNHDYADLDEMEMRTRINNFAQNSADKQTKGVEYVFLAQQEESAALVYEEILRIRLDSIVVVKAPRYNVPFFNNLVLCNMEQLDSLIYKPKFVDAPEEAKIVLKVENTRPKSSYTPEEVDDISKELFDSEGTYAPNFEQFDKGIKVERVEKVDELDDSAGLWDDAFDNIPVEKDGQEEQEDIDIDIDEFEGFETDESSKSGDLPEFSQNNIKEDESDGFESLSELNQSNSQTDKPYKLEKLPDFGELPDFEESPDFGKSSNFGKATITQDILDKSGNLPNFDGGGVMLEKLDKSGELPNFGFENRIERTENNLAEQRTTIDDGLYNEPSPATGADSTAGIRVTPNAFNDAEYADDDEAAMLANQPRVRVDISNEQIKATLHAFANRGNSIAITGCGGCGTSTIAYHLANTIANIGYTVLLVDMDTEGRTQSYISKDNRNCMEHDGANLMAALKSSSGINAHVSIVRPGFRLLTMGLGGDIMPLEKMVEKHKLARFINLAKTSHNFVIYDLPFKSAVGCASDVTFMADNLVLVVDSSNWGVTKTMISVCNIDSDDMTDTVFSKGQILYNKYKSFGKIMGKKVKSAMDVAKVMDAKVIELLGDDPGYYFKDMHICNVINDTPEFEQGWF